MKKQKSEFKEQRDEALYRQFKKIQGEHPELSYDEVLEMTMQSPQPRMWVSFYGVYRALLRIIYNSRPAPKHKSRANLVEEVGRKYERLKRQYIFKDASPYFIASFIVAEPANGFYVSNIYARKTIGQMRKKKQAEWRKNF